MKIDYITYINLPHRSDKKEFIENSLSKTNISYFCTQGVMPILEEEENENVGTARLDLRYRKNNVLGCYQSHQKAIDSLLKISKKSIDGYCLIVEDDLYIHENFWLVIEQLTDYTDEADVLLFDSCNNLVAPCGSHDMVSDHYPITYKIHPQNIMFYPHGHDKPRMMFFGTHCVAIHNSKLKIIQDKLNRYNDIIDIDIFYMLHPEITTYAIQTNLIFQDRFFSTDIPKR